MSNTTTNRTTNKGFSHVGLSTLDPDKTREFYEKVLDSRWYRRHHKIKEGGAIRHIFFDTGRDRLLAFMEPRGFREFRSNTTPASIAGLECQQPFIISPSSPSPGTQESAAN